MPADKLLVSSKFAPPRIGTRSITRSNLLQLLERMGECRVGLVVGSPGFGKTTLLAQWRQSAMKAGAEVAWLSLSADDKYLSTFFVYLTEAMQRLGISIENDLPLDSAVGESLDLYVAAVVDGASGIKRDLYLILDDYQHVADPRAHRLMQKLLDHCPDNLHFIIAARVQPPLSLGRLRLMGQVIEVDCAALPFDLAETRAFLDVNSGSLKLTSEEIHQLHDLTGGWPASLQLIAILSRSRPNTREALQELAWKTDNLQAYLAEDVMAHLPPELVAFMESISICRRFNAGLSSAVSGQEQAKEFLTRLEEENLLIFRIEGDDRRLWYRFHPLFGDFLATHLARREPDEIARLHLRAAHWFAEQGLLAEAVRHAIEGGNLEFAVEIIERVSPSSWGVDYLSPMLRLLDRLPQDLLFSRPRLFFLGCLVYSMSARTVKSEAWLEQFMRSGAAQDADVAHGLPLVQAAIALQRDRTETVIALLEHYQPLADDYPMMRFGHPAMLGDAYVASGRYEEAQRCFDFVSTGEADQEDEMALVLACSSVRCLMMQGRVIEVERRSADLLVQASSAHGYRSRSANLAASMLAESCYELDRVDSAREALANRTALFQVSLPGTMIGSTLCRARLDMLQESASIALDFLERQERHFRRLGLDRAVVHSLAEQVRILLVEGDVPAASERQARLAAIAEKYPGARGSVAEIPVMAALASARINLASNEGEQARASLASVLEFAGSQGRGQLQVTATLLTAVALDMLGLAPEECLLRALGLGRRLELVRTLVDEGTAVQGLLLRLSQAESVQSDIGGYLASLLRGFSDVQSADDSGHGAATRRSVLTPREIAILQLIGQAMTNKRIALTLNISLETVKWNLKNIYVKLGVSSRYDAISWARKHELIH
ncbi:LuxR C-terminal-related transcriptional regulator [Pseudomonas sp. NPDC090755]|uniref:LuxR C-terminal-related transcriptional regulator n=1 Tax=Pseudomonas sp. NPDC090755 TaxID=3364481 RepID=UPI00383A54FA